ncbi:hypothetical protein X797_012162 [Metarhizium robertsii]|uniref:Uncharacterized protein n=1 Tax=Metarhizium robertsii TaxID=568076 RepID=A0A014QQ39_9HYPO|nr:hypothetical protein X797_012162 [Metarhizium robertsii]
MKSSPLLVGLIGLVGLAVAGPLTNTTLAEQTGCDCNKAYKCNDAGDYCPAGYENTSPLWGLGKSCTQISCSEQEYQTKCRPVDTTPDYVSGCDCNKRYVGGTVIDYCEDETSYHSVSGIRGKPFCTLKNCSQKAYEDKCGPVNTTVAEQTACNCSRGYIGQILGDGCAGEGTSYENVETGFGDPFCIQKNCSEKEFNDQCSRPIFPPAEVSGCNCSEKYSLFVNCPDGYESSPDWKGTGLLCIQKSCSADGNRWNCLPNSLLINETNTIR